MRSAAAAAKFVPVRIAMAGMRIRDGVAKLQQRMAPPRVLMLEMISGMWVTQAIGVVAKLGVADHLTETGTAIDALAQKTGAHPGALYRLLRALSSIGIFQELDDRKFRMTAMAECLKTDHPDSIRNLAIFQIDLNWEYWAQLEYCVRLGMNAVEKIHGEEPYEHLAGHPDKARIFDRAMADISKIECEAVLAAYDFSEFATIADIGGGYGTFLGEILKTHSKSKGLLFDLPHVLEGARSFLRQEGLQERVRFESGSHFESIPVGADAYLMKHVIHSWSDDDAIQIMKNVRKVIPNNGKLLLIERIVPDRNVPHSSKFVDLELLVSTGGKERTKEEYAEIMGKAGFQLGKIVPTVSPANVIEAVPVQ